MASRRKQIWEQLASYGLDTTSLDVVQAVVTGQVPLPQGVSLELLSFYLAGRSRAEIEWRRAGQALMEEIFKANVVFTGYEWVSFKVAGGSYTPDFCYLFTDGRWAFVEIKGSKAQKNYRDARSHLRAAASLNPWFAFFEARFEKGAWQIERIDPDLSLLAGMKLTQLSQEVNDGTEPES